MSCAFPLGGQSPGNWETGQSVRVDRQYLCLLQGS